MTQDKSAFAAFLSDLFPNDVIDIGIIEEIESGNVSGPNLKRADLEVMIFFEEIRDELEKEFPDETIIRDCKIQLAVIFGKDEVVDKLEEEALTSSGLDSIGNPSNVGWDPDEENDYC